MTRRAQCSCGALSLSIEGEPDGVVLCHCRACQRRTGAPVGLGAYFPEAAVRVTGVFSTWSRLGSSGGAFTERFCPTCGSTVFWSAEKRSGTIGVAVGALDSPLAPTRSVFEATRHDWLGVPEGIPRFLGPRV